MIEQVLQMVQTQTVTCIDGIVIPVVAETISLDSEGLNAVAFAKEIAVILKQKNIAFKAK